MPAILPALVGALAAAGTTTAVGALATGLSAAFVSVIAGSVGLLVSTGLSLLLNKAPKVHSAEIQAQDRKQAVRSGVAPRNIVYGRAVVAGPVIYMASAGTYSEQIHVVMPLAGHAVHAFDEVRLNAYTIPVTALTAGADGTAGSGVGGAAGHAARIFVRIPANRADGEIDSADISTSGYPTADLKRDALVVINLYDGTQTTGPADLIADKPSEWSSAMALTGIAYIHVNIRYSNEVFPGGFQDLSVELRGKKLWDPRTDTTGYTDNAVLAALDYLRADYGLGVPSSEVDIDIVSAAANVADELVALDVAATTFQSRYTTNGSYKLDQAPVDIMEALLNGWGVCVYVQGLYRLHAAAAEASALSLMESDFAGALEVVRNHPRRENFNAVTGTYIEPDQGWEALAFPKVVSSVYLASDGEEVPVSMDMPFVISAAHAQRLARQKLLLHRSSGFQIRAPLKYSAVQACIWDVLDISIAEFGLSGDLFRITSWSIDPMSGIVNVVLQFDDPNAYAWEATDGAEPILSDPTDLANPLVIPEAVIIDYQTGWRTGNDGTVIPFIQLIWGDVGEFGSPFITAVEAQWRDTTAGTGWQSRTVPATEEDVYLEPVLATHDYDVRIRYLTGVARGPWSTIDSISAEGSELDPISGPSGTAVVAILGGYRVTFTRATAADLQATEVGEDVYPYGTGTSEVSYIGETTGDIFVRMVASGDYAARNVYLRSRNTAHRRSSWTLVGAVTPTTTGTVDIASNAVTETYIDTTFTRQAPSGPGWEDTAISLNVTVATGEELVLIWDARIEDYLSGSAVGGGAEGGTETG